nr:hypothetical protein [Tanacetum cinerariifolium]
KSRIKRYIDTKPNRELIHYCLENPPYELGWKDKFIIDAEGNPTTATHQKAIERLKQGESINVQDLETNLFWEFGKFTSLDGESLESYYSRFYKLMNELTRNKCTVTNHQVNVQFLLQLQPEWQRTVTLVKQSQELKHVSYHKLYVILKQHQHEVNEIRAEKIARVANPLALEKRKAVVNSPQPIYDQEPSMVDDDDEDTNAGYEGQRSGTVAGARDTVGSSMVQKSGIQCYNCKEYGHVARECQKPKRAKDAAYHREKMLLCKQEEAGIQLNAEQADWKDDTNDENDDQELEAHYMYMAKLQQVQNNDHYDVFAIDCQHSEQSEYVHNTYLIEQDAQNVIIKSEDMNYDSDQIEQNDEDVDLAKERELLASLISKLKCEIDETKNHNTLLETSNKVLVEKLKIEIADFKNKNKSLTEANNKLSEVNAHLYADYKKSKDELKHRNTVEYATEMELKCAKLRGDLLSNKMEHKRYSEKDTHIINGLNQTVSELQNKLFAHQDTISILTQQKDAQIKLYKTREDKDIEKVIDLE